MTGWLLLAAGFAAGAWLDPTTLGAGAAPGVWDAAARGAQSAALGTGLLQLLAAAMAEGEKDRAAARLIAGGTLIYAAGYALRLWVPAAVWLLPAGALAAGVGFGMLAYRLSRGRARVGRTLPAAILAGGMLLYAALGLALAVPDRLSTSGLGPGDGLSWRLLRLAQAASAALPVLAFLYSGLSHPALRDRPRPVRERRLERWGGWALLAGAIGMPLVLVAAALLSAHLKYLLPLPADCLVAGTLMAVWLAARRARPLELWGWVLIAASMAAGMLMGGYSFEGPLPTPAFIGEYGDLPRRLVRLAHAYPIVLGLACIFAARRREPGSRTLPAERLLAAAPPVIAAAAVGVAWLGAPSLILAAGPLLASAACLSFAASGPTEPGTRNPHR